MVDGSRQLLSLPGNYQHPLKGIIKASNFDILTKKTAVEEEPLWKGKGRGGKLTLRAQVKAAQELGCVRNKAIMKATLCVIIQGANVLHTGCSSDTASSLVH